VTFTAAVLWSVVGWFLIVWAIVLVIS